MSRQSIRFSLAGLALAVLSVAAPASAQTQPGMTLDVCPDSFSGFPADGPTLTCGCTAEAVKRGTVFGANPYMYQSNVCRAALHAGAIGAQGGQVVASPTKAPLFPAVTRHGVSSRSSSADIGFQFSVAGAQPAVAPAASAAGMTLDVCPDSFSNFPADGPTVTCGCTAEAVKRGTVFGANPYMYQSNVCRAALHAGAIGAQGGQIEAAPTKAPLFPAVTRNGVSSRSSSADIGFQFSVAGARPAVAPAASAAGMTLDVCPDSFANFPEDGPTLTCGCAADAVKLGTVFGANPYMYQSNVCRAALHAGAIGAQGGQVVAMPTKAPLFPAVTRNGVSSRSSSGDIGFQFTVAGIAPAAPGLSSAGMTLDVCPDSFSNFPEDGPTLTCGCAADAMKRGTVFGANPYMYQSNVCQAALHAGAIGARGGQVVASPTKAPLFPAVTRNGVSSRSSNADVGFQIAVTAAPMPAPAAAPPPAPETDARGRPVQAPIARTLKTLGKVQVYINFATASDRIEASSAPVLSELLATLRDDPAMKVELVGHTDNQGSSPYNLDLSHRRAASVYAWLGQRGVGRDRLRSSGRGFLEPIADNDSDRGRALNRRVEVKLAE